VSSVAEVAPTLDLQQKDLVDNLGRLLDGDTSIQAMTSTPVPLQGAPINSLSSYIASRTSYRHRQLPADYPIPLSTMSRIVPLLDPLDLDIFISYSTVDATRRGHILVPSIRPAPAFSLVEDLRTLVEGGAKQGRTMYEETGRLRRALVDSVLEGKLGLEEDPVNARVKAGDKGKARVSLEEG
jgi:hypothetical protein